MKYLAAFAIGVFILLVGSISAQEPNDKWNDLSPIFISPYGNSGIELVGKLRRLTDESEIDLNTCESQFVIFQLNGDKSMSAITLFTKWDRSTPGLPEDLGSFLKKVSVGEDGKIAANYGEIRIPDDLKRLLSLTVEAMVFRTNNRAYSDNAMRNAFPTVIFSSYGKQGVAFSPENGSPAGIIVGSLNQIIQSKRAQDEKKLYHDTKNAITSVYELIKPRSGTWRLDVQDPFYKDLEP
jgi:hypothetical protein